jgi:hypothetical protein
MSLEGWEILFERRIASIVDLLNKPPRGPSAEGAWRRDLAREMKEFRWLAETFQDAVNETATARGFAPDRG